MKKLAFIIGLLLFLYITAPKAEAACKTQLAYHGCPGQVLCGSSGGQIECCDSQSECLSILEKNAKKVCDLVPGDKKGACESCFSQGEAWTAIGCIPSSPSGFVGKFLNLGIGIAGGLAFLLILFGGLQILTSAGNPERLNAGKELLTSAISGLILVALSLFLLRLIGFNILQIPGFG